LRRLFSSHHPISLGNTPRPGRAFRVLAAATVLSIFALVTLGGVVRLTGSGLGCPDWPLCHGRVIPPTDTQTLIEYSHRLMASVVGVLVVATALIAWRSYRSLPRLLVPATLGVALLVAQVLLGGFTVLRELPSEIVLAHLATAEALMASMVVVFMVALPSGQARPGTPTPGFSDTVPISIEAPEKGRDWLRTLTPVSVMAVYALLLTGSYVTVSGATASCGQWWPICQGSFLPEGYYPMMHMVHRVVALLAGVLIVTVLVLAWHRKHQYRALAWAAAVVGVAFLVQVIVGALVVWTGFPIAPRLLHLAVATLVWVGLSTLGVLVFISPSASLRTESESSRAGPSPEGSRRIKGVSRA